jgi:hypothetical protein
MLGEPDPAMLLEGVAELLEGDARKAISDPRISFRVLIAAALCKTLAAELKKGEAAEGAELERLSSLVPSEAPPAKATSGTEQRRKAISDLDRALIRKIRANKLDPETKKKITDHLRETMRAELSITSPKFDLSAEIE